MSDTWRNPDPGAVRSALAELGVELLPQQVEKWIQWIPRQTAMLNVPESTYAALGDPETWAALIFCADEYSPTGPDVLENNVGGQAIAATVHSVLERLAIDFADPDDLANDLSVRMEIIDEAVFLSLALYSQTSTMLAALLASIPTLADACIHTLGGDPETVSRQVARFTSHEVAELFEFDDRLRIALAAAIDPVSDLRSTAGDIELPAVLVEEFAALLNIFYGLDAQHLIEFVPVPAFGGKMLGEFAEECIALAGDLEEVVEYASF